MIHLDTFVEEIPSRVNGNSNSNNIIRSLLPFDPSSLANTPIYICSMLDLEAV